ncbi:MAG: hypothetical protein AAF266_05640 [Planctomycetota bacterium]
MSEATLPEENAVADGIDTLDVTQVAVAEVDAGPACEKCGLATDAAACPQCGWYPSLGIHVEIDESFERVMNTVPSEPQAEETAAPTVPEWQKHLQVWQGAIPGWAWLMIGTTVAIIGAAIAARVVTIPTPMLQTYIGVGGLIAGLAIAAITHLTGFVLCSFDDADFGVFDVITKPVKTWKALLSQLPTRLWLANSLNVGITTALAAAVIVGGIPYEKLLDWGFKAKAKQSLVAMIAEKAGEGPGNGSDNLEDAMGDFAGKGADGLTGGGKVPTPPAAKPRQPLECLIIGYQVSNDGKIRALLLAAESYGKLKYVGKVKPNFDAETNKLMKQRLSDNRSTRPFVKCPESGLWVRPRFPCKATHRGWERGKRPEDLEWGELLEEIKMPW